MARNEEKSQSMLNRWLELKKEEAGFNRPKKRRPHLVELCDNLAEGEKWRIQVLKEISKYVLLIQNESLEEHRVRELNDRINKLIREKTHWQRRIKELGGPDYFALSPEDEYVNSHYAPIKAPGGYYYFGSAKKLPGVPELLKPEALSPEEIKRTRYDLYKGIDGDYYGLRDDEDDLLEKKEKEVEEEERKKLIEDWYKTQKEKGEMLDTSFEQYPIEQDNLYYVPVPTIEEIEAILLERRKSDLLNKYVRHTTE